MNSNPPILGQTTAPITLKQAVQICGNERELNRFKSNHQRLTFSFKLTHATLALLVTGSDLLKVGNGYALRGHKAQNDDTLTRLTRGESRLLLSQVVAAAPSRLQMLKDLDARRKMRPPQPMWND